MKATKIHTTVYVEDLEVPVTFYVCPAEPDVGIMSEYIEVDEIDLTAVYESVTKQLESADLSEHFEDPRY